METGIRLRLYKMKRRFLKSFSFRKNRLINGLYSNKEIFSKIYNQNLWHSKESVSGGGSELRRTRFLIPFLNKTFKDYSIRSVLDLPCGDFNWMSRVDLDGIEYTGGDIVDELIEANIQRYRDLKNVGFKVIDLVNDPLPKCDLVFVRDCLPHLSNKDVFKALENIRSSGSGYLLTTTYPEHENADILTGDFRALNLQKEPFNLPEPLLVFNENNDEDEGRLSDKSMALWRIDGLEYS